MQSTRLIKRRIKTTKNIRQITKAMEMVAASKMRKAQHQATSAKPYATKLQESLRRLAMATDAGKHPLLKKNKHGSQLIMLVGPDKGLTGGMITNLLKEVDSAVNSLDGQIECVTIGKKAGEYAAKMGYHIVADFSNLSDHLTFQDTLPFSQLILKGYLSSQFKEVRIVYMDFVSTLVQSPRVNRLLPIKFETDISLAMTPSQVIDENQEAKYEYMFEPSAQAILNWLLPYYVENQIYQTILDAKASEHSARMVAMKNASDNAGEIIDSLTLDYNKSRQAAITNELLDIVTSSYNN